MGHPRLVATIPYRTDRNLGLAYNEAMEMLRDDQWAALCDHDAMFTTPVWYGQILDAIERYPQGTFTGVTNRVGSHTDSPELTWQKAHEADENNHDYGYHRQLGAERLHIPTIRDVTDAHRLMSGTIIVISKESWKAMGGFVDGLRGVDYSCHIKLMQAGRRVYCIDGLYIYHWRRGDGTDHLKGTPMANWRKLLPDSDPRAHVPMVPEYFQ